MASGVLVEPQVLCSALLQGQLSDMWLYWSAFIGSAFSVSFFAHLWRRVPVKTENEFIFFRYSGRGAKLLHNFRSLYLGLLVIPFLMSFSILAYGKIVCFILGLTLPTAILSIGFVLVLLTYLNSLKWRLRMDFGLFLLFILLFAILFCTLVHVTGGFGHLATTVKACKPSFTIIPSIGNKNFSAFLVFVLVQWWSATLLDYPDMNGQKLMASTTSKALVKSVFLPSLFTVLFRVFLFTLPFMAVGYGFSHGIVDSELAFTNLFVKALPSWMLVLVLVLFLIPMVSLVQNMQNWGGSLLIENFYKHTINLHCSEEKARKLGLLAMLYLLLVSGLISYYATSLVSITHYLFAITAGVGPVFMLRWYWWRINAWTQLTAMLAALVYPPILDWLYNSNASVQQLIGFIEHTYTLDYYPIKIIILTIAVSGTWLLISCITPPTEEVVLQRFVTTIKPGGFWKNFRSSGKTFSKLRIAAWLLQTGNGFLMYFIFWNFLIGSYLVTAGLLLLFTLCFFAAYQLIQMANEQYEGTFET
jgi:Na+/proline symporter